MIPDPSIAPIIIFILRVMNNAIGTIRLILMTRGNTAWGFMFASIEFAYTAGIVLGRLRGDAVFTTPSTRSR
jgi:hypothetical protein